MSRTLEQEREDLGRAFRDLGAELAKVYEPPITRLLDLFVRFLNRHPIPRWLEVAMTPLDWLATQTDRFLRWLWHG